MFKNIITCAVFAGAFSGIISSILQLFLVSPLLFEAELYESGMRVHFNPLGSPESPAGAPNLWDNPARHLMTLGFNLVTFTGFGFLLTAAFALLERKNYIIKKEQGIIGGLCGFLILYLVPTIGLPPTLPGTIETIVETRQVWWLSAVALTGTGIFILIFQKTAPAIILGILFLILPHLFGYPEGEIYYGVAPPELAGKFSARSSSVGLISWLILGLITSQIWSNLKKA